MLEIREYQDVFGRSPFATWFTDLESSVAARITVGIARMEQGNLSNAKGVGAGVQEYRLDFGPGYRVYFGETEQLRYFCSAAEARGISSAASMRPSCAGWTRSSASEPRDKS